MMMMIRVEDRNRWIKNRAMAGGVRSWNFLQRRRYGKLFFRMSASWEKERLLREEDVRYLPLLLLLLSRLSFDLVGCERGDGRCAGFFVM